jgi:hypothetical protein
MINDEIDIRIEKLTVFEDNAMKKNENQLANILQIRRLEYESFKSWIESRSDDVR